MSDKEEEILHDISPMSIASKTPGTAPNLAQIPTELVLNILQYFTVTRGYAELEDEKRRQAENAITVAALCSLARTCRRLNDLVTPFLYGSVLGVVTPGRWPSVIDFLKTITKRPALMDHVRYIECAWHGNMPEEILFHANLTSNTQTMLEQHEHWGPIVSRIPKPPNTGPLLAAERLLASFISFAHNLESIAIPVYFLQDVITLLPQYLTGLRELSVTSMDNGIGAFRTAAAPESDENHLLRLFWRDHSKRIIRGFPGNDSCSVAVEELVLEANWDLASIQVVLRRCKLLRKFKVRWDWPVMRGGAPIDLEILRQYLAPFESTLEYLAIDTLHADWPVEVFEKEPIGSLCEFTSLKHLEASGMVLWGDEGDTDDEDEPGEPPVPRQPPLSSILPSSLETLVIRKEWDDDMKDGLSGLAGDCATSQPNLKVVDCSWKPVPMPYGKNLITSFERANVMLKLNTNQVYEPKEDAT